MTPPRPSPDKASLAKPSLGRKRKQGRNKRKPTVTGNEPSSEDECPTDHSTTDTESLTSDDDELSEPAGDYCRRCNPNRFAHCSWASSLRRGVAGKNCDTRDLPKRPRSARRFVTQKKCYNLSSGLSTRIRNKLQQGYMDKLHEGETESDHCPDCSGRLAMCDFNPVCDRVPQNIMLKPQNVRFKERGSDHKIGRVLHGSSLLSPEFTMRLVQHLDQALYREADSSSLRKRYLRVCGTEGDLFAYGHNSNCVPVVAAEPIEKDLIKFINAIMSEQNELVRNGLRKDEHYVDYCCNMLQIVVGNHKGGAYHAHDDSSFLLCSDGNPELEGILPPRDHQQTFTLILALDQTRDGAMQSRHAA